VQRRTSKAWRTSTVGRSRPRIGRAACASRNPAGCSQKSKPARREPIDEAQEPPLGVGPAASAEDLARKLIERTWTLCTGFYVRGHEDYLFLNDAIYEDAAQEYAIVKGCVGAAEHVQLESITFSWCRYEEACCFVKQALAGEMDLSSFRQTVYPRLDPIAEHRTCPLCA